MSVLIVTSLGDIVVDLHTDRCPLTTKNFLKLCKMKYYNGCLFHKVEKDFLAQTGDRTGTGTGGDSVYKFLYGEQARFFEDEIHPDLKHSKTGTVAMASAGENLNASQVFGIVEEKEGLDTLTKINEAYVDDQSRPFKDIRLQEVLMERPEFIFYMSLILKTDMFLEDNTPGRIKHTYILDDPFDDPPQLAEFIPEKSPEGKPNDEIADERLEDNWVPLDETLAPEELEEVIRAKEAHTNAAILESVGDIPDAEMKPPENVLFVCKLNPVTQVSDLLLLLLLLLLQKYFLKDEDLYTIFSRFGNVTSAEIIRDYKTGDSLCYAFIGRTSGPQDWDTPAVPININSYQVQYGSYEVCTDEKDIFFERKHGKGTSQLSRLVGSSTKAGLAGIKPILVGTAFFFFKWLGSSMLDHPEAENWCDGCFKCGAPDHFAQDCDQQPDNGQRGPKYVLKDDNTQRGGDDHQRYDMLFDEDNMDSEHTRQEQTKKRKTDHHNYEHSTGRGYDKKGSERQRHDDNGSRRIREYESNQGSKRHYDHLRYEDKEHRRRHDSSRHRDDGDNRSSRSGRHENDRSDGDWHRKDERDHQKRSKDSDKHRKDDRYYDRKSRDQHYESYKERRHRDDRRK
ncbi:peptidyl-prolyl cis-trans isomerase CYP59 [Cocos nucifera]|uniref:Peptidyl-prolyl cis-trans isomerase n=1 Tax=Cocos nucifera TaxID=13894 RepID=A0A8K0IH37_COCNU|nr:peptidyl-prolyl cis-trans isomerase CYP59 [Cocos nucifera]